MRLSRTDLVPVLAIVTGGVIGATLSFNFLALSPPASDVPAPESASAAYESVEVLRSIRLQELKPYSTAVYTFEQIEAFRRFEEAQLLLERDRMEEATEIEALRQFQEAQLLLERDRMEGIEEAVELARHQLEEVQRALERRQESLLHLREEL